VQDKGKGKIDYNQSLGESNTNWSNAWVLHDAGGRSAGEAKHNGSSNSYPVRVCADLSLSS
jgi:hypothetical protein